MTIHERSGLTRAEIQVITGIADNLDAMTRNLTAPHEPHICKIFGCGQLLTFQEQLYGDKCIIHSMQAKTIGKSHLE